MVVVVLPWVSMKLTVEVEAKAKELAVLKLMKELKTLYHCLI